MAAKKKRSKNKTGATRTTEEKSYGFSWMILASLVALFVAFLLYLDKIPGIEKGKFSTSQHGKNTPSGQQKDTQKLPAPEHQFDFYTILPDREVEIDNVEEEARKKSITLKETKQVSQPSQSGQGIVQAKQDSSNSSSSHAVQKTSRAQSMMLYQLQVGAFKELSKADAMKARLAFLGVESNIQLIRLNGQKMYRVRVGPSTDSQKIEQIKRRLKAQNINTFTQKLKG